MSLKKVFIISLLFVQLNSITEFHEVFKLPAFAEHFIEHSKADGDLSLSDFIAMHYFGNDEPDADAAEDMKLPFKSHPELTYSISIIADVPSNPYEKVDHVFSIGEDVIPYEHFLYKNSTLSSIWQPPKFC